MATFIVEELKIELDIAAAHALRRRFFLDHGTTLRGLMLEHGIEPRRFLDYVHDIDLSPVEADPVRGDISVESPVGRALVGKRAGERVCVQVPQGTIELTIKAVS